MNYESLIILPVDRACLGSQHIIKLNKNDNKQKEVGGLLITTSQSHLSNLAVGKVKKVI